MDWLFQRLTTDLTLNHAKIVREDEEPKMADSNDHLHELADRFTYHAPQPDQIKKYGSLRTRGKELAFLIEELCPDSDEKSTALTRLDEVIMHANAAIARHS